VMNMESVYHGVTIRVNETSWAHVWRLRSRYLGTGYDTLHGSALPYRQFLEPEIRTSHKGGIILYMAR
jgi:hypothetical protein